MPKLLQINTVASYSSTGRIVVGIGQMANKEGWQNYVGFGRKDEVENSNTYRIGNKLDNYLHVAETRLFDRHGLSSRMATKKFINWIEEIEPDIIQLHNLHGYYLNIPILFKFLENFEGPVVMSLHDSWNLTGHCPQFEHIGCEKWITSCHKCPLTREYPKSLGIDRSTKNQLMKKNWFTKVDNLTLVTSSEWSVDIIRKSFLSNKEIVKISNGVDTNIFYPRENSKLKAKYNLENKFIILGVAAVWTVNKGYKDFLKLSSKLNTDEVLILVGLDEKQTKEIPKNILGIQRTQDVHELAEFYSISDVFLNLTYGDTFPTVNLEALACGTPIVTYKTGGSTEPVNSNTGFVVDQGDLDASLEQVREIKKIGKEHYIKKCREFAVDNYEKDAQFLKYIKLYKRLLEN
ncbi:glycosyltransferase [Croceivirga thetidis]|uniref:Glycosyltransferase n=1 Tax=Croceivirga thetidis TaxID=2721623 RepID=A0ABX1GQ36_9FLAO|nr:glycosyltransferase [Croceivirga thetidis]NKI32004.1 glycosyltransferase [Croceivirga thetidis]